MKKISIVILDYGIGNLYSITNVLNSLGFEVKISSNRLEILKADYLILPGVGNFKFAMANIIKNKIFNVILERRSLNKPILGICLGMHLFFKTSEESNDLEGLNLFDGKISRIPSDKNTKVPHIGWHDIDNFQIKTGNNKNKINFSNVRYYFVHSYYLSDYENIKCKLKINYFGLKIPAIIQSGSVTGIQFHPEISGKFGIEFYKKYLS